MQEIGIYEVVQRPSGWVLRRNDRTPLVEFPTREQAVRAALAVSRDEGLIRMRIRRADGQVQTIETAEMSTFAA